MLVAKNGQGQLVYAWQSKPDRAYYCPECGQPLRLCVGTQKAAYFAHCRRSSCQLDQGESSQHLTGKHQMWQWANDHGWRPALEVYLPRIQQRPDLLLSAGPKKVAMEFQCSPLSFERLCQRNAGYQQLGLGFIWYLGPRYRHKLRAVKRAQFVQNYFGQPAIFLWDLNRCRPIYSRVAMTTAASSRLIIKQTYHLCYYPRAQLNLRQKVYQAGHLLNCCPLQAHCHAPTPFLMKESDFSWRINVLLWLENMPLHYEWAQDKWWASLQRQTRWQSCPCLSTDRLRHFQTWQLQEFTQELLATHILGRNRSGYYLKQHPVWFESISDKLNAITRHGE